MKFGYLVLEHFGEMNLKNFLVDSSLQQHNYLLAQKKYQNLQTEYFSKQFE